MSFESAIASLGPSQRMRRAMPWIGGLFIVVIVAFAGYDIVRGYRATVNNTVRELDSQARVIAEQAARSLQAIDVVLRHLAEQFQAGNLQAMSTADLRAYLKEQAVGLVQVDGLMIVHADGRIRASTYIDPAQEGSVNVSSQPIFQEARAVKGPVPAGEPRMRIDVARKSSVDGRWIFPVVRRLETPSGEFAGGISVRGRIDYFQDFYRDVQLDQGTKITLMHQNGTLLARHPPAEQLLGKHFALFDELLGAAQTENSGLSRSVSPIDGVDRFGALQKVSEYPLAVIVTRDVDVALAPWRAQAVGTAVRTLALGSLAALLIAMMMRQLARLHEARESLEVSRERYAVAVAGSDDGIWDHDFATRRVFISKRARQLSAMPPGPEEEALEDWLAMLNDSIHPDDHARREAAMEEHLSGRSPIYEVEIRHRHPDGAYRWVRVRGLCIRDAAGNPIRMAGSVGDIDARKSAEEARRQSEERFALAVAGANDGIVDWDIANDRMFMSERALQMFGVKSEVNVRSRNEWITLVRFHPDDVMPMVESFRWIEEGHGDIREGEYRAQHGEDIYRWIRIRGRLVRDAAGKPVRWAGSVSDIDAERCAQEALRQSEERFSLAVEGSNDGILDWDIVNDRMFTSKRAMLIAGVDSDVTVRTRAEWAAALQLHPDDVQRHAEDFRRHLEGEVGVRDGEYRVRHSDGKYHWVRVRGMSVRDETGRAVRWAGSVSDINPHKRIEAALRESELRYQLAVDGSNQGLWDWDMGSDTLFLSARAQEFMGLEPGEPLRLRREWIALSPYHPEDLPAVRALISAHLRGESRYFTADYRLRHPSGDWHWYRQRGLALRDVAGKPYRMAGSMEDITLQKRGEDERARLEGQLLQAKKLEAMGTLAGGIAHDFNNILSAILGYGEMAQKDAPEGSAQRRHIDASLSAGMRAKSLVERILAFSRSGMGERAPVHVQSVVEEALNLLAASLPPHVRLDRDLNAGDAAVLGDPTQIHQVVMNLCTNAVQAMNAMGRLTVSLDLVDKFETMAATSALPGGSYVRLAVRDTGHGIAPDVMERIFDPFFTTKGVGVGTGLGLSLVHGIVTDLGGGIDVESPAGQGTVFTVYLPRCGTVAASERIDEAVPNGSGETILLVDDEEPLVRLGEEMVALLGYEPVGFTASTEALQAFRRSPERFHAVLSDEAMPGMTGSELAREIRVIRPDIPIVLMSGYVSPALLARARELEVADVLAKPLVARDIARGLHNALHKKENA
jgi:PAS domain S-box-containing protein